MKIVNYETGEIVNENSTTEQLSEARRHLVIRKKVLEDMLKDLDSLLEPTVNKLLEKGENKLCDFWSIRQGGFIFDKEKFLEKAGIETQQEYNEAKTTIKSIEKGYKKRKKYSLVFPKL